MRILFSPKNAFTALVLLVWSQTILLHYFKAAVSQLPFIGNYAEALIVFIFVFFIVFSLPYIRITTNDFLMIFTVIIIFYANYFIYFNNEVIVSECVSNFTLCVLPFYILGLSLGQFKEKDKTIDYMYLTSLITIFIDILYRFTNSIFMDNITSLYMGDMDKAYKILPHCCLILYYAFKKTNIINIIFAIIGGGYLLMLGTRGAAFLYIAMLFVMLIMGQNSKKVFIKLTGLLLAGFLFLQSSLYNIALSWLYNKARSLGLSVRIFDKLMSGNVLTSDGRILIQSQVLEAIVRHPILGNGICSDRMITGSYSHNIVLELCIDFGVVIGLIVFITFIFSIIKGYVHSIIINEKGLILSLFFSSFCMMFLSGSYLEETLPVFLLGVCVASNRKYRINKINSGG